MDDLVDDAKRELQKVMDAHQLLAKVCKPEDRRRLIQEGNEDDLDFQKQVKNLRSLIRKKKVENPSVVPQSGSSLGPRYAQLERVGLPEFDGSYENWPLFVQEWHDLQEGQG